MKNVEKRQEVLDVLAKLGATGSTTSKSASQIADACTVVDVAHRTSVRRKKRSWEQAHVERIRKILTKLVQKNLVQKVTRTDGAGHVTVEYHLDGVASRLKDADQPQAHIN